MTTLTLLLLFVVLALQLLLLYRQRSALQQQQQQAEQQARHQFNQFEAYHYLRDRLQLHQGIPHTTDWSAAPDFLKLIVDHVLEQKPRGIVECSSGATTLMLARCCEMNGAGHVYSLENGEEYVAKSRGHLRRYGLESQATVLHAPLQNYEINQHEFQWYALNDLPDNSIEMLIIDGPPGFIQQHSRYPALPLLFDKLADGAVVFMDDAARPDEKEIVKMWLQDYPALEHRYINSERGCAVLINKR